MTVHKLTLSISILAASLMLAAPAKAGPSAEDLDYRVIRPLVVTTKISNGLRFDVITPKSFALEDRQEAGWYSDELLIVRVVKTGELLHAQPLKSSGIEFLKGAKSKKLSNDYVVIREHTGGASCCFIIHAFQTTPKFKKLLEHNNDFFDMTEVIHGEHTLELHKEPLFSVGSSAHPQYNPGIFKLKKNGWE
tara:strand:+ start:316 stop:891 length:576 start_codon:yes stop_codon:yes gene_type:complete